MQSKILWFVKRKGLSEDLDPSNTRFVAGKYFGPISSPGSGLRDEGLRFSHFAEIIGQRSRRAPVLNPIALNEMFRNEFSSQVFTRGVHSSYDVFCKSCALASWALYSIASYSSWRVSICGKSPSNVPASCRVL